MARKQVAFTWQVLLDQVESDEANARPLVCASTEERQVQVRTARRGRRLWWGMVGLALMVAVVAGYRLYCTAQAGVAVLESELQGAVVLDSYTAANPANEAEHAPPALQSFDLRDGVAAVEVVVDDPSRPTPYRETRFFRETERGWQPATPDASFWGPWQQWTSDYFIFRFYHRDYAAVVETAPALDALYARLHRDLGRAMPDADAKVIVEVLPNYEFEKHGLPSATEDRIQVPSPALLQIPVDVSDTEVLALSISVRLVHRLFPRVSADWRTNENRPAGWWWSPLTEGLRLWLLMDNDPLFARWRHDILTWYLADSCQPCLAQSAALPVRFQEFCQTISKSGLYPLNLYIAIPCEGYFLDTENYICFPPAPPHT